MSLSGKNCQERYRRRRQGSGTLMGIQDGRLGRRLSRTNQPALVSRLISPFHKRLPKGNRELTPERDSRNNRRLHRINLKEIKDAKVAHIGPLTRRVWRIPKARTLWLYLVDDTDISGSGKVSRELGQIEMASCPAACRMLVRGIDVGKSLMFVSRERREAAVLATLAACQREKSAQSTVSKETNETRG